MDVYSRCSLSIPDLQDERGFKVCVILDITVPPSLPLWWILGGGGNLGVPEGIQYRMWSDPEENSSVLLYGEFRIRQPNVAHECNIKREKQKGK